MVLKRADEMRDFRTSTELSDICVIVEKTEFHLHKFPLFVNCEFFRALCRCGMMDENKVTLSQFPGGARIFSLIADYCYGIEIDISSSNVVELRCAAEFLQMTSNGNLASEADSALMHILCVRNGMPTLGSRIVDVLLSACQLGEIAQHTNIISVCFDAILKVMNKQCLPENIVAALTELPIEWFVSFIIAARDVSISVPQIARLVNEYLKKMAKQHKVCIEEVLELKSLKHEGYDERDITTVEEFGDMLDAILLELPVESSPWKVMDHEMICLLFTLAEKLNCKCKGWLLNAISEDLQDIPLEILVTMPTNTVVNIAERSIDIASPITLCDTIDRYLRERTKQKTITLEEFETIIRTIPKDYRPQHDSILLTAEELFSTTKASEETKLKILEYVDAHRLQDETIREVFERNNIPSSFIAGLAITLSSRLRHELYEAKAKLAEKENEIREIHARVSDVIKGQWEHNDVTLNVTPKNETNTRVQFLKVEPRNTSSGLLMEHEVYDGKLTLCLRASCGTSTKTFLFDPFNEQLFEITKSKHDNLMVGENYEKRKHAASYWPFADVTS